VLGAWKEMRVRFPLPALFIGKSANNDSCSHNMHAGKS